MPDKFRRFESVEVNHKFRDGTSRLVSGHIVNRGENDGTWRVNLHATPAIVVIVNENDITSLE
jgi:hypothetical protein